MVIEITGTDINCIGNLVRGDTRFARLVEQCEASLRYALAGIPRH
jgi:hypothetical protein